MLWVLCIAQLKAMTRGLCAALSHCGKIFLGMNAIWACHCVKLVSTPKNSGLLAVKNSSKGFTSVAVIYDCVSGLSVKLPMWKHVWMLAVYMHSTAGLPCERCGGSRGCLWQWWWVCTPPLALCPVVCSPAPHLSDRYREEEVSRVCV